MPRLAIRSRLAALAVVALLSLASSAAAGTVTWTDWTSGTTGTSGTVSGTMGGVSVTYTGDVTFFQTGGGINYFSHAVTKFPYTSATVSNDPTAAEMIGLSGAGITNTVTFSSAVLNPVMALVSVGRPSYAVTYDFDGAPFSILSQDTGYWGGGTSSFTTAAGDKLIGLEAHGVIQFQGSFTSISWTTSPTEYWHGVTFGDLGPPVVPLPPAAWMGLGLLGGLGLLRRRRRRDA